ncbi:MAG TPA: TM0106 family RecB-like putative nuclease [Mycobacterium sp.]|nr:TM0106 family RecB-like putative nuclease [Mycobacterium sp.]
MFVAFEDAEAQVIYSASDLAAASRCEYALLRALDAKLGRGPGVDGEDDELLRRTIELGDAHERRILEEFIARHGDGVVRIGRPAYTLAAFQSAARATAEAFARRPPVVYQAALFDGRFVGFADFVVAEGDGYRVLDTKLARRAKIQALLQIAGYADALRGMGVPIANTVGLILGDRTTVDYPVDDLIPVYRQQRDHLRGLLDAHLASGAPVSWGDPTVAACMRCECCVPHVVEDDDVLLVAGMRMTQRDTLMAAGIGTVADLAVSTGPVDGMAASTLAGLRTQARLQVQQRDTGAPQFEIADGDALGALPAKNPGDLFFDFEGDPLWTDDGVTWGLEYMWGVLDTADNFTPLWADDRRSERKTFTDFLKLVRKRRRRYPDMHIYHYAAYERTKLLELAARYGICEDEVDDLLRADVLVDLFPIVRSSLRVGTPSYSLKALEPLYMGSELRSGEVTNAAASITQYERYRALLDDGRADEAAAVLKEIRDYNEYDCRSTRRLRDWLLLRAFECGVTHLTRPVEKGEAVPPLDETARALMDFAGDGVTIDRTPEQCAAALIQTARGYLARERKPYWWAHFQRLNHPVDEWGDTSGVFLADKAVVEDEWHKPARKRKYRRHVRLTGVLQGGTLDGRPQALYDRPAPAGLDDEHPDRRAAHDVKVLDVAEVEGVPVEVLVEELESDAGQFTQVPMALTPAKPFGTAKLEEAIEALATETATAVAEGRLPRCAVVDILCRATPTTLSSSSLPRLADDVTSITAAVLDLDRSYVAVHGPPGTGKTYTAARVIKSLVTDHGWSVGVVAQSHSVVAHLLNKIVEAGVDAALVAKKASNDATPSDRFTVIADDGHADFLATHPACVIGGTAWDFANDARVSSGRLDLLAIDEASQFSLGYTIAVARAARNIMLLGDPQQLGQVSTGSHPEPVDHSALGWLMEGHDVLPAEYGYFLEQTHRMHPALCRVDSALSYDNRLKPHPKTAARTLDGYEPGVHTLSVRHEGRSTSSPEEAVVIAAEIKRLIGAQWTDEHGSRRLEQKDVLVVAPYNLQVLQLRTVLEEAGLGHVLVGTVDKLQGREAAVVFVSMTASAIDDILRGMPFLLNRNRLNVAISRAMYRTVIVRSALLTDYLPVTPGGLVDLGAFLSLTACDRTTD